jgi:molybdate transport system regulatory protein
MKDLHRASETCHTISAMTREAPPRPGPNCLPRFRVFYKDEIALGPGKIELLKAIAQSGSLRRAATALGMSYMRAWQLVRTMNRCFREPLVQLARGGSTHGGATLSSTGTAALELYDKLEAESLAATRNTRQELDKLLRTSPRS